MATYVVYESLSQLSWWEAPKTSVVGMVITLVSLIVIPTLFFLKRRAAEPLKSRSLAANSKQTLGCVLLSVAVLIGLSLNALFGLRWVDPLIDPGIVGFFAKEGYEAITYHTVCSC